MRYDLDAKGKKEVVDVQNVRRVFFQADPISAAASSAVLEVKRAFGADGPSVSFASSQTIALDGSSILEIDVTDTGWLHLVCTTAEAGISVEVEYSTAGSMSGQAGRVSEDLDAAVARTGIDSSRSYKAFMLAQPRNTTNTAAVEIKRRLEYSLGAISFSPAATLTLDGSTITEIDTDGTGQIVPVCTTAQSAQAVDLWWYMREEVVEDSVPVARSTEGTAFPSSPVDGQLFTRTDFDMPEIFYWDDTRSKWLGELRSIGMSRASAASSGSLDLRAAGGVQFNTSRGHLTPSALTIVGVEIFSAATFTGDITYREGSSDVATLLSVSSSRSGYSHTLNVSVDADTGWPHKYFIIDNISSGSVNNPIVTVYVRRTES